MSGRRKWWHRSEAEQAWEEHWRRQTQERKEARTALAQSVDEEARRLAEAGVVLPPQCTNAMLRGKVGHYRGQLAEERVVRILNQSTERPSWLIEARRAPEDVDQLGIDVLVFTADLGTLPLQVKSCQEAAEGYRRQHADIARIVGVVVAPVEMPDAEAWAVAMAELHRLREAVLLGEQNPTQGAA